MQFFNHLQCHIAKKLRDFEVQLAWSGAHLWCSTLSLGSTAATKAAHMQKGTKVRSSHMTLHVVCTCVCLCVRLVFAAWCLLGAVMLASQRAWHNFCRATHKNCIIVAVHACVCVCACDYNCNCNCYRYVCVHCVCCCVAITVNTVILRAICVGIWQSK